MSILITRSSTVVVGGGEDNSLIGNKLRSMSDGAWDTLGGIDTFDPDPTGAGDSQFSYVQRGQYYDGKIYFFGGAHGTLSPGRDRLFLNVYDLATNNWLYQVHWPTDSQDYDHGFYCGSVDRSNGDYIGHSPYGTKTLKRWKLSDQTFGTDISPPTNGSPSSGPFYAVEYHPNISTGAIIWANEWVIARTTSATGASWTELLVGSESESAAHNDPVIAYQAKDDCVYIGGKGGVGSSTNNRNELQKISSSGVLSNNLADSPVPFGVWDAAATDTAMLLASGNSANKLLAISRNKNIYEYTDSASGAGSWSGVIDSVPTGLISGSGVAQTGADCFFVTIDDDVRNIHGIVAFKLATSNTMSSTIHLWKR